MTVGAGRFCKPLDHGDRDIHPDPARQNNAHGVVFIVVFRMGRKRSGTKYGFAVAARLLCDHRIFTHEFRPISE